MNEIFGAIIDFIIWIIAFIGSIYVVYIIFFSGGSRINDEDLDRVSKGGDKF
jgi:hypothetical protein